MTGWTYRDTDDEIVAATGRAIEDIFCEDGEAAFRKLERSVLESVSQGDRQVVSTGGVLSSTREPGAPWTRRAS